MELTHAMQGEAPVSEVDPLALGLINVNPLFGWQDGGQAQETGLQRVAQVTAEPLIAQWRDQPLQ